MKNKNAGETTMVGKVFFPLKKKNIQFQFKCNTVRLAMVLNPQYNEKKSLVENTQRYTF